MTAIGTLAPALMLGTALVFSGVAAFLAYLALRGRDREGRPPSTAQPLLLGSIACSVLSGALVVLALLVSR